MQLIHVLSLGSILILLHSCSLVPAQLERLPSKDHLGKTKDLSLLLGAALEDEKNSDHALAHFIENWKKEGRGNSGRLQIHPNQEPWTIKFISHSAGNFNFNEFDYIFPAEDFKVKKIKHFQREGVGAPLVGFSENKYKEPIDQFRPPEGIVTPLTAYLTKTGERQASIQLLCPLRNSSSPITNSSLAADFSVPWAALLERTGDLWRTGITDFLSHSSRPPQLYLVEAYDPNKEPLIMIHGLLSNQVIWAKISNQIWGDDELRNRYQIWHYRYDTTAPALYSARKLRDQLKQLRGILDPKREHFASHHSSLLTHSMGGLVGKALVLEPDDAFWNAAFKVPHEQLKLSDEDRKVLTNAFEWKSDKSIGRIIFANVPHHGSNFANSFIGRFGRLVAAPPQPFSKFYQRISIDNPGVFTPEYEELGQGKLDSVGSLSPKQPTLAILNQLRPKHPVIFHSIIGNRGRKGPIEKSSDGVVPYSSSHFPLAVSEKIVPHGHRSFHHQEAVDEIKRILKLPRGKGNIEF